MRRVPEHVELVRVLLLFGRSKYVLLCWAPEKVSHVTLVFFFCFCICAQLGTILNNLNANMADEREMCAEQSQPAHHLHTINEILIFFASIVHTPNLNFNHA